MSEQTFQLVLIVDGNIPDPSIRVADLATDVANNDYKIQNTSDNFIVLEFGPDESRIPFNFRLFGNDIAEGTKAFRTFFAQETGTPDFSEPAVLSPTAVIAIEDDDG